MPCPTAVCVISYGHSSTQVQEALKGARGLSNSVCYILDDSSGTAPQAQGATTAETPSQLGYSGAVSYLIDSLLPNDVTRLILINPDAEVSTCTLQALQSSRRVLAVPQIVDRKGRLTNVLPCASPFLEALTAIFGWRLVSRFRPRLSSDSATREMSLGKPWVPGGAVLSADISFMREYPLLPEMFWLEMSDMSRRASHLDEKFEIVFAPASHTGASTELHASSAVVKSQVFARGNYVRAHGNTATRILYKVLVPLAIPRQATRAGLARREYSALLAIAWGKRDWRRP